MGAPRTRQMVMRLWRIVELIHARRRGITVPLLVEQLGASRATVYRDLKLLEEAGVPLVVETINGETRYALDREDLPALRPSAMQLSALRLARQTLAPLDGTALLRELDGLIAVRSGPAAETAIRRTGAPRSAPAIVEAIDRAVHAGLRLRIKYRAVRSGMAWREVEPVALRLMDDHLYLVAWDLARSGWRTFKVARILYATFGAEPASPRPPFDEARLFGGAVRIWSADLVDVAIRIAPEVSWLIPEWPLHASQTVDERDDGAVVRARVAGIAEAMRWALRWGKNAEVIEPPELRAAIAMELSGALARYGPATRAVSRKLRLPARTIR